MRKIFPWIFVIFSVLLLVSATLDRGLLAKERRTENIKNLLSKSLQTVTFQQYDSNNMVSWVSTNGQIVSFLPTGGGSGLFFPKGSGNTAVFASGLWVVGKVGADIRSAAAEFTTEFVGGPLGGNPESPRNKIFRVSPAFPNGLDINGDGDFNDAFDDVRGEGFDSSTGEFDPWSAWPVENGAPVDAAGNPAILGSSMLWMVFNDGDPFAHGNLWATAPLNLEIQTTMFGFDRADPTGNIMFIKWLLINKGTESIDSTFASIWHDDDVGTAGDDLVGVDVPVSLGFTYNGDAVDGVYGTAVPAVGTDFFQGPIVLSPGDVARAFGRQIPDFRNLPLTSFAKYINGGPVQFQDPETAPEAFNFMKGLTKLGDPLINDITGDTTVFANDGDPAAGIGWLDTNPGDRRYLMSTGPFTIAPGDSQEIVGSIIIAQGTNNLNAVSALRFFDNFAQTAFDNDFDLPVAVSPDFQVQGLDHEISITWETNSQAVESVTKGGYLFEGYNVYVGESLTGPWTRLATFDVENDLAIILDGIFDIETAIVSELPVAFGTNNGVQRFISIKNDVFNGNQPLINNRQHYVAVTSYIANAALAPRVIESPRVGKVVIPHEPDLGDVINSATGQQIAADHVNGTASAKITVQIVDPEALTGDSYKVDFRSLGSLTLTNTTTNTVLLDDQAADLATANSAGIANGPFEGFALAVDGSFEAPITFLGGTPTTDADPSDGDLVLWGDAILFGGATGLWNEFTGAAAPGTDILQRDLEFRFTGVSADGGVDSPITSGGQWSTQWERGAFGEADQSAFASVPVRLPFEIWDVENNRQVNIAVINRNADDAAPYGNGVGDPATPGMEPRWRITGRDYMVIIMSDYDEQKAMTGQIRWDENPGEFVTWLLFFEQQGDAIWSSGDVFLVEYANPLIPGIDEFTFSTTANSRDDMTLARNQAIEKINVFPNPYLGANIEERDPINRFITFTHLPTDGETVIRIFTIAGTMVKTIKHDGSSQLCRWDLRNEQSLPVASGIYIVLMDMKGIGAQKMMKLAIMQPEERLDIF